MDILNIKYLCSNCFHNCIHSSQHYCFCVTLYNTISILFQILSRLRNSFQFCNCYSCTSWSIHSYINHSGKINLFIINIIKGIALLRVKDAYNIKRELYISLIMWITGAVSFYVAASIPYVNIVTDRYVPYGVIFWIVAWYESLLKSFIHQGGSSCVYCDSNNRNIS